MVDSFCYYLTSNAQATMQEAESSVVEEEQEKHAAPEVTEATDKAVEQWIAKGRYRKAGITRPVAAAEIGIPRYQLTAWVKANAYESFSRWMTTLRIEEAKRVLQEHPDWNNETVADHCGFSRTHFQRIFKQETGMAPAEYIRRK